MQRFSIPCLASGIPGYALDPTAIAPEIARRKRGLPLRPATKKEYQRALLTYAAALHSKPLAEIRRGQIAEVVQRVAKERGEVSAMRCRAALSRLSSWAIANGHADVNPVTGTEGFETPKRSRVLSDIELRMIWTSTADPADFNVIVRLMLWTGTRRSEPGSMADSELDGSRRSVPGSRIKNGRALVLPLPRQAVDALAAWPRIEDRDLLFGRGHKGFRAGQTPRSSSTSRSSSGGEPWPRNKARIQRRSSWRGGPCTI